MTTLLVIRHAYAGERSEWHDDDARRPLQPYGKEQAALLVDQLDEYPIQRILTSPYDRCVQTIEPLAAARGIRWQAHDDLIETTPRERVRALLTELADRSTALCTHGDVIGALIGELRLLGVDVGRNPRWDKGSTWLLEGDGGVVTSATYLAPPA